MSQLLVCVIVKTWHSENICYRDSCQTNPTNNLGFARRKKNAFIFSDDADEMLPATATCSTRSRRTKTDSPSPRRISPDRATTRRPSCTRRWATSCSSFSRGNARRQSRTSASTRRITTTMDTSFTGWRWNFSLKKLYSLIISNNPFLISI